MNILTLPELLAQSHDPAYQELPASQKEIVLRLALAFEDHSDISLQLTPKELTDNLHIGTPALWQSFLQLVPTQYYIKAQMQFNAQVASRKAMAALTKEAAAGDTSAAKQINEVAGIFDKQNDNRIVVLHQIQRPLQSSDQSKEETQA